MGRALGLTLAALGLAALAPAGQLKVWHDEAAEAPFDATASRRYEVVNSGAHGVTQLGLERHATPGQGPRYVALFAADGSIRLEAASHPDRQGRFRGEIPRWKFDAVAQFALDAGYLEYEHTYQSPTFDPATVFTSLVHSGERKVVKNHARAGPPALWALEELLDKLIDEATWKRVDAFPEDAGQAAGEGR